MEIEGKGFSRPPLYLCGALNRGKENVNSLAGRKRPSLRMLRALICARTLILRRDSTHNPSAYALQLIKLYSSNIASDPPRAVPALGGGPDLLFTGHYTFWKIHNSTHFTGFWHWSSTKWVKYGGWIVTVAVRGVVAVAVAEIFPLFREGPRRARDYVRRGRRAPRDWSAAARPGLQATCLQAGSRLVSRIVITMCAQHFSNTSQKSDNNCASNFYKLQLFQHVLYLRSLVILKRFEVSLHIN